MRPTFRSAPVAACTRATDGADADYMTRMPHEAALRGLAAHLRTQRLAILAAWRRAIEVDPELTSPSSLPRKQLDDHIPQVLDALDRALLRAAQHEAAPVPDARVSAAAHGLHRWQQGYDLREVAREWMHLQRCLCDCLGSYANDQPALSPAVVTAAYRAIAGACGEGVTESTDRYFALQQVEAAGYVQDLEAALEQVRELERQRAKLWHEAAHDLRGNLGVVANATAGLSLQNVPDAVRENFLRLLQKNVSALHAMLDDVMSLARLQAGQEQREVRPFDAAVLMRELCEGLQPLAEQRGLYLRTDGPDVFPVSGDAIKVKRIAQNLLINAFKYTHRGGVCVSWGASRADDAGRWRMCIEDTGPGIQIGPGAPLTEALDAATEQARVAQHNVDGIGAREGVGEDPGISRSPPHTLPASQQAGEGIGLAIVKRLSELLDATIELESRPGLGTVFRILLPRRYPNVPGAARETPP